MSKILKKYLLKKQVKKIYRQNAKVVGKVTLLKKKKNKTKNEKNSLIC